MMASRSGPLSEDAIVAELVARHRCHTVLLYGSRARGQANDASDWDVLGVVAEGEKSRDARKIGDDYLDAFIETDASLASLEPGHLRLLGARVLRDEKGFAKELLQRIVVFRAAGPKKLTADEARQRREWLTRMLERAKGGSTIADYRRAWLLYELLPAYFELRGEWYLGPKESLAWMEEHARDAHHLFSSALQPGAEGDDLQRLVAFVLGGETSRRAS